MKLSDDWEHLATFASRLDVSRRTVRRWIKAGSVEVKRISRRLILCRFSRTVADIGGQLRTPQAAAPSTSPAPR